MITTDRGDAYPLWAQSPNGHLTGRGVQIAVVDSGWDRTIADPRAVPGVSFVDPANELLSRFSRDDHDRIGHGTMCARLILRIAQDAAVVPVRVFGERLITSPSTIVAAVRWVMTTHVRLINLSLGTHRRDALSLLGRAFADAREAGIITIAAGARGSIPAVFDSVISVGVGNARSCFEYFYHAGQEIEIRSTGVRTAPCGKVTPLLAGSSFAAPNITGLVALMLERSPDLSVADVRAELRDHATRRASP